MDRRTVLFVILLTLALYGVNIYFERQHQENLSEWKAQNKSKLIQKQHELESEISEHTPSVKDVPLVDIYSDHEGKEFLTTGVRTGNSILTLGWSKNIPPQIFSRPHGTSEALEEFKITLLPDAVGNLAVYQTNNLEPLKIRPLPNFGTYYLQVVIPSHSPEAPPTVVLGEFVDGRYELPIEKLVKLKQEINGEKVEGEPDIFKENALVLIKKDDQVEPVAFYRYANHDFIHLEELPGLKTIVVKSAQTLTSPTTATAGEKVSKEEKFYVLESPYQQLVFSNFGGALAEINLPFASSTNTQSVVRQIEFDREMVEEHPQNAHFPAHTFFTPGANSKLEEHSQGKLGGYYPLLRRDLIQSGNNKLLRVPPRYYALNTVSEYPELAELVYEVKQFDQNTIVFEANQSQRRITKTFSIPQEKDAPYILNLMIKIEGDSRGLWLTSGVPEVEWISGSPAPVVKYRITRNQKGEVENIDLPADSLTVTSVHPDWICNSNGFLGSIMDALVEIDPGYRVQRISGDVVPSRLVELSSDRFKAQDMPGFMTFLPLKSTGGVMKFRIFAGPFSDRILRTVDATFTDPATGYNPDYIAAQSFHGWFAFISEPFAKFLFILMNFFHSITNSWGFSIILLTVALRIMMYPLNAWSNKSMMRMQQIGPEVAAIQEKYKKNPKQAQIEVMNLYRERGVNPVSGCLPMLIQMPFLIGMFDLLKSTFELRGASFIPGWIDNLAAPDVLFSWTTPIFFIGNQFHLLPIILGLVMFLQQKMMAPAPANPNELTDQQRQQRAMGTMMSVVFTLMFYNFPSGLNIYWLSSMILGIVQQWWNTKRMKAIQTNKTLTKQKGS